ncbi:uncharacterized protein LOC118450869 [Vespa mandarinia]|uniref:uncharacterized protein LOC118450869 n=1 Tax=Vespa mandarinia TaxID=7446 RepID=UPI00161FF732|nr:uncharacterized protein LOC118450869 [Vespa mandarinia]
MEHDFDYSHNPPSNNISFKIRLRNINPLYENILREWYSVNTNLIEINDVAIWNSEKGITKMVTNSLYERRYNLQNLIMRANILKKNDELDGIVGKILKELCVTLNFNYDIASKKEYRNGIQQRDLVFYITNDRLNVVDFTLPLVISKSCFFIRKLETFTVKWSSYFLTSTHFVWISIIQLLTAVSILLNFFKLKTEVNRKIGYLLIDNFLEIGGIFYQQELVGLIQCFLIHVLFDFFNSYICTKYSSDVDFYKNFIQHGTYQFSIFRAPAYYDKFLLIFISLNRGTFINERVKSCKARNFPIRESASILEA